MKCLNDGEVMNTMWLYDITIDVCPRCGSVWLDGGELPKLTSKFVVDATPNELEALDLLTQPGVGRSVSSDFWKETRHLCPRDGDSLSKHFFAGDSGIGIETCHTCNGFWLDGNELGAIWHYLKPDPVLESAMASFLQEQKAGEELRQKLEEIPLRVFQFAVLVVTAPPLALLLLAKPITDVLLADGRAGVFNVMNFEKR